MQEAIEWAESVLREDWRVLDKEYEVSIPCYEVADMTNLFRDRVIPRLGVHAVEVQNQVMNGAVEESRDHDDFPVMIWSKLVCGIDSAARVKSTQVKISMNYREISAMGDVFLEGKLHMHQTKQYLHLLDSFVQAGGVDNKEMRIRYLNLLEGPK